MRRPRSQRLARRAALPAGRLLIDGRRSRPAVAESSTSRARAAACAARWLESLADPVTGAIADDDTQLIKFHGSYQQDDRDLREERRQQKLEPAYSFMIRTRLPGGVVTPAQWLALDAHRDATTPTARCA